MRLGTAPHIVQAPPQPLKSREVNPYAVMGKKRGGGPFSLIKTFLSLKTIVNLSFPDPELLDQLPCNKAAQMKWRCRY